MRRCIIVGAAPISRPDKVIEYLKEDDFFIFCDAGLAHRKLINKTPDLVIGDFDSYPPGDYGDTINYPHIKDDTDTALAVEEAIKRGYEDFLFIGCVGRRLDHTLGNLSILLHLDNLGLKGLMVDDYSEMEIASRKPLYIPPTFSQFSLMNIDGDAKSVKIEDAFYAHESIDFPSSNTIGLSNETLPGKTAKVSVGEGRLLLLRIFDTV